MLINVMLPFNFAYYSAYRFEHFLEMKSGITRVNRNSNGFTQNYLNKFLNSGLGITSH